MSGQCAPNLRGASLVGRDGGGRSYAAQMDGGKKSNGVVVVAVGPSTREG